MKKVLIPMVLSICTILVLPITVTASPLDGNITAIGKTNEKIYINGGTVNIGDSKGDSSNSNGNNSNNSGQSVNTSINKSISKSFDEIINGANKDQSSENFLDGNNNHLVIVDDITVDKNQLQGFLNNYYKYNGVVKTTEYGTAKLVPASLNTNEIINELHTAEKNRGFHSPNSVSGGYLPYKNYFPETKWNQNEHKTNTDIFENGLFDKPSMNERADSIKTYMNSNSILDTVDTLYITEYKVTNENTEAVIKGRQIGGYTWRVFRNDEINPYYTTVTKDPQLALIFYTPGTFKIQQTVTKEVTHYDNMKYKKYEYWVVKETGQIIYARASNGNSRLNIQEPTYEELNVCDPIYIKITEEDVGNTYTATSGSIRKDQVERIQ